MSAPLNLNEDAYLIEMFDSYSKTIFHNALVDLLRKNKNDQREIVASERVQYLFDLQGCEDAYPSDSFYLEGTEAIYSCRIWNERLYHAMKKLSKKKRTMLIMSYWYGMTDVEIAKYFGVTTRTIFNWRADAFKKIRHNYERGSP